MIDELKESYISDELAITKKRMNSFGGGQPYLHTHILLKVLGNIYRIILNFRGFRYEI
jgi:hypothetical protein